MVKLELGNEPDEADLILRAREAETEQAEADEEPAAETGGGPRKRAGHPRRNGAVRLAESFLAAHPVTGVLHEVDRLSTHPEKTS